MKEEIIFRDTKTLRTPVGEFAAESGNGERIRFSVKTNSWNLPCEARDDSGRVLGRIRTDTNYTMTIKTADLQMGVVYRVFFSAGRWDYRCSFDNATSYTTVIDDWAVGIGAYDPNDEEKEKQARIITVKIGGIEQQMILKMPNYDVTKFSGYIIEPLKELNGFAFILLDKSLDEVCFEVAWIKVEEYPAKEYEKAVGMWVC